MSDRVRLHPSWRERLASELASPTMAALRAFLINEKASGKVVYPPGPLIFNALDRTPFESVKVVILGQDPYHGPGQAHGLSFSVPRGMAVPPSLVNIYAEIQRDLGIAAPRHGNLEAWADRGVLLLNSVLTVEAGQAASHQGRGWEVFTDRVVALLAAEREHLVFLLWGSHAQRKAGMVDPHRHLLLKAPHPSPLSAYRGFLGCSHFSACNRYLAEHGLGEIDWSATE